jgi:hypothetical protein
LFVRAFCLRGHDCLDEPIAGNHDDAIGVSDYDVTVSHG